MRILLASTASHVPPRGGATRSNLVWLDHLSRSGHECRIVGSALPNDSEKRAQLDNERMTPGLSSPVDGVEEAHIGSIHVYSVRDPARRVHVLRDEIQGFRPDWVLVSSEDLGQVLLREALRSAPGRVVYLAHTPQFFPFGPASWNADPGSAKLLKDVAEIVAIGRYMAGYIGKHLGRSPAVIHPPIYGDPPFPNFASYERGHVTMINPCALKGISIFLTLAQGFPEYPFAVVPGWGTTAADRRALEKLPNVTFLPNAKHIDEILAVTRLLLMPSLWYEGFGLIVMESMLRGIPVLASDSGGLVEACQGTGYIVKVKPIAHYETVFDERGLPKPVVEPIDIGPWESGLRTLLKDQGAYFRESNASRQAALHFVAGLDATSMEELLRSLAPAPPQAERPTRPADREREALRNLSPEKRALLLRKLSHRPPQRPSE